MVKRTGLIIAALTVVVAGVTGAWADDAFGYGKMSDARSYWDRPYEPS